MDPRLPPPGAIWQGQRELRADLRSSLRLALVIALCGVLAGLVWWWLAPRADFRITDAGPVAVGDPSEELFAADDAVFTLVLAGFGLVAGLAAWFSRRRRGVATLLALAVGCSAMAVVAWQVGELLGPGPSGTELSTVGAVVTTALRLASIAALAAAPFAALFAYVSCTVFVSDDALGRVEPVPGLAGPGPAGPGLPGPEDPVSAPPDDELSLVEVPPPGRPQ